MINADLKYPAAAGRLDGYRKALKQLRVPFEPTLLRTGGWWQDDGYEHALALLQLKQIPTAIFCASDRIAVGVYDALKERSLRIPEDISVVGFDDQELLAAHTRPPLSTVRIPYFEMGSWAVDRLINVDGDRKSLTNRPIKLECPLVLRASVDKPAAQKRYSHRIPISAKS
jgi:LacI family transcriptional regulator